jgi:hypothetical protein
MHRLRILLGLLCTLLSGVAATAQQSGGTVLNGRWLSGDSSGDTVFEFTQTAGRVESRFVTVNRTNRSFGFRPGDVNFVGTFDGHQLTGKIYQHYPLQYKSSCPAQWIKPQDAVMVLSDDGLRISGKARHSMIFRDCSEKEDGWRVIVYRREPEDLDFDIVSPSSPVPLKPKVPIPVPTDEKPTRIRIDAGQSSALVDGEIDFNVGLAGRGAPRVKADRDYQISLSTNRGTVTPGEVKLTKGFSEVTAKLQSSSPGSVELKAATTQGLRPADQVSTFCASGEISKLRLTNNRQGAPADGTTPISVSIKFVDDRDTPVTGQQLKSPGVEYQGVGKWQVANTEGPMPSQDLTIPFGQCVGTVELTSYQAGAASLRITFLKQSESRSFVFFVPLTAMLLVWAGIGGIGGMFVKLYQNRLTRYRLGYYVVQFLIGIIGGVVVLLMCYFGLTTWESPRFPSGHAIGFLLGVAGGFLGATTMHKLVAVVFPPPQ